MDILEKIFQKLWISGNVKNNLHGKELLKNEKAFTAFAYALFKKQLQPTLSPSRGFIGLSGNILFLPEKISIFTSEELNKKVYLNLLLLISGAYHIGLISKESQQNPLLQRLEFLERIPAVNRFLDREFLHFAHWQNEIYTEMQNHTSFDRGNIFNYWKNQYLQRVSSSYERKKWITEFKSNEVIPSYLLLTVPCLAHGQTYKLAKPFSESKDGSNKEKSEVTTELKKKYQDQIERVDLEEEKANPVTHSFEKLETADEYQGGYRFDSGDDELQDHSEALDELSLSKVTTGGETAKSVYSMEGFFNFSGESSILKNSSKRSFIYPEWNTLDFKYRENHCQLEETLPTEVESVGTVSGIFKDNLKLQYRHEILIWKQKINQLLNYPLWQNRLLDGDEIDYDAYIRDWADLKKNLPVTQRWYSSKHKLTQEISILILFDQSMSADSWVQNSRVLDVIIKSIGLMGMLFEDCDLKMEIAGTWSETRHHCHYQIYKHENSPWELFYHQADKIEAQGYTRLGPGIRHGVKNLMAMEGSKKLLLLITDGKPTDLDGYEGRYGVEDIKKSCLEAESKGILPFALTIDSEAKQIFPKMFKHYSILNKPENLPQELYKIILLLMGSLYR